MEGHASDRFEVCPSREGKQKDPCPTLWDKSQAPAIPPKLTQKIAPTRFTHHHACPRLITGGIPVEAYLSAALFRFALGSPFAELSHASFTPSEALFGMTFAGYYSSSMVLDYGMIIGTGLFDCQELFEFLGKVTIRAEKAS